MSNLRFRGDVPPNRLIAFEGVVGVKRVRLNGRWLSGTRASRMRSVACLPNGRSTRTRWTGARHG